MEKRLEISHSIWLHVYIRLRPVGLIINEYQFLQSRIAGRQFPVSRIGSSAYHLQIIQFSTDYIFHNRLTLSDIAPFPFIFRIKTSICTRISLFLPYA